MDKRPLTQTIADVREQRTQNKVFGLTDPDRWSGAKQLVDFIEELINADKPVQHKIEKPVRD